MSVEEFRDRDADYLACIELDQIRPPTVSGMSRAVQPVSPCAWTRA